MVRGAAVPFERPAAGGAHRLADCGRTGKASLPSAGPHGGFSEEIWAFGDRSAKVTRSDDHALALAKDGNAVTTHALGKPGDYIVRVQRGSSIAHLHLHVRVAVSASRPR